MRALLCLEEDKKGLGAGRVEKVECPVSNGTEMFVLRFV